MMRRFFLLGALLLGLTMTFSSCQCSDKPEIGPVEGSQATATTPDFTATA